MEGGRRTCSGKRGAVHVVRMAETDGHYDGIMHYDGDEKGRGRPGAVTHKVDHLPTVSESQRRQPRSVPLMPDGDAQGVRRPCVASCCSPPLLTRTIPIKNAKVNQTAP